MGGVTYELHLHSCLSPCGDSEMTPASIAGMAMLNGVRVAALTDHNTCKNCPAFYEACNNYGVVPIAGMELTTMEEIHVVCLFESLEDAMAFDEFVESHRMRVKNRPDIFGDQLIMNADDEVIGVDEDLLILATDLDLTTVANIVRERGGVAIPAHIDKQSNGMLGILGTFPEEPGFRTVEFYDVKKIDEYKNLFPQIRKMNIITNSDAHYLEHMRLDPPEFDFLEDSSSPESLRRAVISHLRGI